MILRFWFWKSFCRKMISRFWFSKSFDVILANLCTLDPFDVNCRANYWTRHPQIFRTYSRSSLELLKITFSFLKNYLCSEHCFCHLRILFGHESSLLRCLQSLKKHKFFENLKLIFRSLGDFPQYSKSQQIWSISWA